jgi:putative peptidoglycan lipid II flippase
MRDEPLTSSSKEQQNHSLQALNPNVKDEGARPAPQASYLRQAGLVGALTLASRVLGMLESRVLAHYLGAGLAADAFFVAFRLPNLLRRFTAEGVMVAAFLPTLHEVEVVEGERAGRAFVARFVGSLASLLVGVVGLGILGMSLMIGLMELGKVAPGAPVAAKFLELGRVLTGASAAPPEWALTILLGRIMFGYVLLVSLSAALGGVLNLRGRFGLPAATPILWNVVVIALGIGIVKAFAWETPERAAVAFAIAVLAAGAVQLAMLWPSYRSLGHGIALGLHWSDPVVRRTLGRMAPGVLGAGVYQINVLVSTLLASALPNGAQTVLFNATMMGELVLGLFAVSLATVSLPLLTRQAEAKDWDAFQESVSLGLRSTAVLALPASVGMALLATPIVALIFQTGRFGPAEVAWTAKTLMFQASGLLFIAATRVLVPACYAVKDYMGPVHVAIVGVAANLALSVLLMPALGTGGIALANGLASLIGLVLLWLLLERSLGRMPTREVLVAWGRMGIAAGLMGLVAWAGRDALDLAQFRGVTDTALRLLPLIGAAALVYWAALLGVRSPEAHTLLRRLIDKLRGVEAF